jgi:hypothetical protein
VNIGCEERDDDLHDCVKHFMLLEHFVVMVTNIDRRKSEEETLSLKKMADAIQNVGERYEFALPYQNNVDSFPENCSTALHRLKCTERKIKKTGLVQKYDDKIAEYVDKEGYAEKMEDLGDLHIDQNYGAFFIFLSKMLVS